MGDEVGIVRANMVLLGSVDRRRRASGAIRGILLCQPSSQFGPPLNTRTLELSMTYVEISSCVVVRYDRYKAIDYLVEQVDRLVEMVEFWD